MQLKATLVIILVVVIGLVTAVEIGLRILFGFGKPLVYIGDEQIGYLLAPNQNTRRNGKRIQINDYSMRSSVIHKNRTASTLRILLLGDSIANGGWWTDQDETISSLMRGSLVTQTTDVTTSLGDGKYQDVEVLNASANSWGPRNELAYLQRFGSFESQAIVLLINTDDLFATQPTSLPVGRDRNYPARKPHGAIVEVFERYVQKPKPIPELDAIYNEGGDRVGINLEAIGKIQAFAQQHNSKFLLAMTPLVRELGEPGSRDYEIKARRRLLEFTKIQNVTYIDFLPLFNSHADAKGLYHDHIHLNLQGNQFVSGAIEQSLIKLLESKVAI